MDEAVFKRIPPHNDEAERAVIGSMMMDQDAVQIASEQLQKEDFYNGQYGVIFAALVEMHQQGIGADLVTIQAKLREMEIPPELTSVEYIGDLINSVPTSANVRHYVKIVQEKSVLRSLIKVTESITGNCYLDKHPLEDILEELVGEIWDEHDEVTEDFRKQSDGSWLVSGSASVDDLYEELDLPEEEDIDSNTVNGLVQEKTCHLPKVGDRFTLGEYDGVVTRTAKRRVTEVRLTPAAPAEDAEKDDEKDKRFSRIAQRGESR